MLPSQGLTHRAITELNRLGDSRQLSGLECESVAWTCPEFQESRSGRLEVNCPVERESERKREMGIWSLLNPDLTQ